jgi:hypothetical protein
MCFLCAALHEDKALASGCDDGGGCGGGGGGGGSGGGGSGGGGGGGVGCGGGSDGGGGGDGIGASSRSSLSSLAAALIDDVDDDMGAHETLDSTALECGVASSGLLSLLGGMMTLIVASDEATVQNPILQAIQRLCETELPDAFVAGVIVPSLFKVPTNLFSPSMLSWLRFLNHFLRPIAPFVGF